MWMGNWYQYWALKLGVAVEQRADPARSPARWRSAQAFDSVLVVLGLHVFGLEQMRDPLREALVARRGLSRQFPFSHLQHLLL